MRHIRSPCVSPHYSASDADNATLKASGNSDINELLCRMTNEKVSPQCASFVNVSRDAFASFSEKLRFLESAYRAKMLWVDQRGSHTHAMVSSQFLPTSDSNCKEQSGGERLDQGEPCTLQSGQNTRCSAVFY